VAAKVKIRLNLIRNKIPIAKDTSIQNRQPVNYLRNRLSHALPPAIVLAKAIHKKKKAPYPE
jgi:hypothetical protein